MTAIYPRDHVFSAITFALFHDTGWYHVDMTKAEVLGFGNGQGCNFVESHCMTWDGSTAQPLYNEFCTGDNSPTCTHDHFSTGWCPMEKHVTGVNWES